MSDSTVTEIMKSGPLEIIENPTYLEDHGFMITHLSEIWNDEWSLNPKKLETPETTDE